MNDTINVWMFLENFVKIFLLSNIDVCKTGPFARDELNAIDGLFGRVIQVIRNDNFIIRL